MIFLGWISGRQAEPPPPTPDSPILLTLSEPVPPRPDPVSLDQPDGPWGDPGAAAAEAPVTDAVAAPVPAPPRPLPPRRPVVQPPPQVMTRPVSGAPTVAAMATVSDTQLVGAATAGAGGGGGGTGGEGAGGQGCDMVRRLQDALRGDSEVRAAVAAPYRGRAILVWDGDWVQSPGEAGKGLAGVRQAIALEVAFAPDACKMQPMRGLALITFADGSRLALGTGRWRWADLLK